MNENFILSLIEKFNTSPAVSLEVKQGEDKLVLKKKEAFDRLPKGAFPAQPGFIPVSAAPQAGSAPVPPAPSAGPVPAPEKSPEAGEDPSLVQIKSPIVGTFYRAPSPDSPVYVEEGKSIKKGDPLCILEAMKMMNTLECEFDCTIQKILVHNGDLVEFEQPLFLVRKN